MTNAALAYEVISMIVAGLKAAQAANRDVTTEELMAAIDVLAARTAEQKAKLAARPD